MKSVLTALRPLRSLFAICICALLFFTAMPSFAGIAAPMKNEPNPSANKAAKEYEQAGREALERSGPGPTLKESQEMTREGGLNEVQGKAGLEEMKRPSNAGGVPTVEKDIKNVLEKAQEKISGVTE